MQDIVVGDAFKRQATLGGRSSGGGDMLIIEDSKEQEAIEADMEGPPAVVFNYTLSSETYPTPNTGTENSVERAVIVTSTESLPSGREGIPEMNGDFFNYQPLPMPGDHMMGEGVEDEVDFAEDSQQYLDEELEYQEAHYEELEP